jgi:2-iminobutanoate/2-iminopropanoate deaminase
MLKYINPATIAPPYSNYSQAVLAPPGLRWLHVSGQLGVDRAGHVAEGFTAQMELAMENVFAILTDAGMSRCDLTMLRVFAAGNDPETVDAYRRVRDSFLGGHAAAALFVAVSGFSDRSFLVEIEAVAAAE